MLGEARAHDGLEGVEDLTGSGTAGLRQQGEVEHRRVAVVTDLDGAERGTEVVHALLALAGAGDGQLVARQRLRRSGTEHRFRDGAAEAVDGLDPVLDFGDRFLERGGSVDEPHRAGGGHSLGEHRREVLGAAASQAMACDELTVTRTRKGKESVDDLRPALRNIEVGHDGDTPVLELTLLTQSRGARTREVLDALDSFVGVGLTEHRALRTSQWIERGGARLEPLEADAFAHALEASAS